MPHVLGRRGIVQQGHAPPGQALHRLVDMEEQGDDRPAGDALVGQGAEVGVGAAVIHGGKIKQPAPGRPGQEKEICVFLPAQPADAQL